MSKYASLLFNPEEYHHIGPFRFPVFHDLVPGEAEEIEAISKQQSKSTFKSIKLAQRIAQDKKISTKEAVDMLSKVTSEENQDILYDYAADLEDLENTALSATQQKIAFATVFMRYRGQAALGDNGEWQTLTDWSEQDTRHIPGKLMDQIFDFIIWERDGWPSAEGNAEEPTTDKPPSPKKS